jgi:hypothetical protein
MEWRTRSRSRKQRPAPSVELVRAVATLSRVHGLRALVDAVSLVVAQHERRRGGQ